MFAYTLSSSDILSLIGLIGLAWILIASAIVDRMLRRRRILRLEAIEKETQVWGQRFFPDDSLQRTAAKVVFILWQVASLKIADITPDCSLVELRIEDHDGFQILQRLRTEFGGRPPDIVGYDTVESLIHYFNLSLKERQ